MTLWTHYLLLFAALLIVVLFFLVRRLVRSEQRFRMMAEFSGDIVSMKAPDGKCLYTSPSIERVLGFRAHTCPSEYAHPNDKDRVQAALRSAMSAKQPTRITFRAVTASNGVVWLETMLRPLPSGEVISTSRDVTDRKRVEDLYRILADSLPRSTFVLFDAGHRILLGAGPLLRMDSTLVGRVEGRDMVEVFRNLFDQDQIREARRLWSSAVVGRTGTMEVALRGGIYEIQFVPVMADNAIIGGLMIATDVTGERQREAALQNRTDDLERSNRDLEQFADIASHELKTPLRHISGFAEILAEEHEGLLSNDADMCISNITQGVREMQGVIEALLRYSRAKTSEERMQQVDLKWLLNQVLKSIDRRIEAAGGRVDVDWDSLPIVRGDPVLLKQLIENLIVNGIKFSSPNPTVQVSAARDLFDWVIAVEDNGPGVEVEHREFIFQMFKRSRVDVEGSGIGLALCKKIVGIHRGKIWVEDGSGPPQRRGALFKFTLPARVREEITQH